MSFLPEHPDALIKVTCQALNSEQDETVIMSPLLQFKSKVLDTDDLIFIIVYTNLGGTITRKWSPIYKTEIKCTKSESSPYKYEFNEFTV